MLLFSTDIDGTIYDGRETADVQQPLEATDPPRPDCVIAGVGTQTLRFRAECNGRSPGRRPRYRPELRGGGANRDGLGSGVERPPEGCQNPFKSSWYWRNKGRDDPDAIDRALWEAGLDARGAYSSERDLDILPAKTNKGNAICWLSTWLEIPRENIIVAGESGNDASMFLIERGKGILVANAEALLEAAPPTDSHRASQHCADGGVEGLRTLVPCLELNET